VGPCGLEGTSPISGNQLHSYLLTYTTSNGVLSAVARGDSGAVSTSCSRTSSSVDSDRTFMDSASDHDDVHLHPPHSDSPSHHSPANRNASAHLPESTQPASSEWSDGSRQAPSDTGDVNMTFFGTKTLIIVFDHLQTKTLSWRTTSLIDAACNLGYVILH